jgi:hypothetical protein
MLEEHHLNGDDCVKYGQVVELKNGMGMWNSAAQLGNSQRWNTGTTILVAPRLSPTVEDHGIIMQGMCVICYAQDVRCKYPRDCKCVFSLDFQ